MPVHEELLCYYSEYYRAACKGEFQEAGKDSFEVELDGDALHVIGSWLYTGTIQFFDPSKSLALCMVYLFGDFIDSPALRRSCMTQIQKLGFVDGTRRLWHYHSIKRIYSGSPESSPLRRYTLDMFTTHFNPDYMPSFSVHKDDAPQEFLYELMCRCAKRSSKPSENNCSCCHDFCKYHDHETQGGEKSELVTLIPGLVLTNNLLT